jgi:hypothetical protein
MGTAVPATAPRTDTRDTLLIRRVIPREFGPADRARRNIAPGTGGVPFDMDTRADSMIATHTGRYIASAPDCHSAST